MKRSLYKEGLAAAALLLVLTLIFLGRDLFPKPGYAIGAHDMRALFYPWFTFMKESLRAGSLPLWDPYQFLGYPFLSNPQVGFFYPITWLAFILPVNLAISWYVAFHIWLSATGMFIFVKEMGGRWMGSLLAAIIFGFSGYTAARLWAGHIGLLATVAWLPWLLWMTLWSIRRKSVWAAILAGLPFGLSILAGHLPTFIYVGFIWMSFIIFLVIQDRNAWRLILRQAFIVAFIGVGLASIQLIPFTQLSLNSQRLSSSSFDFATDYSLPPAHLVTLLLPEFFGEPTRIGYWSVPTFEELTYYAGLLVFILMVLASVKPTRQVWYYLILMVGGLWLALGRDSALYQVAYDLFPPIRMMRAPARAAVLYVFAGSALVGHTFSSWQGYSFSIKTSSLSKLVRWFLPLMILIGVAVLVGTGGAFLAVHPTETSGRLWHQVGGYATAIIILTLTFVLLRAFLISKPEQTVRKQALAIGLILVVIADLWGFGLKLIRQESMEPNQLWVHAKSVIGDREARVLPWGVSIFDQSGSTDVKLHSLFGYQALEPADLVAFASYVPDPRSTAYDVLAADYVIAPVSLDQFTEGEAGLTLIKKWDDAAVYKRATALPTIRLVYDYEVIKDRTTVIERVHQADFDGSKTAILDHEPGCVSQPSPIGDGEVTLNESRAGYWKISTDSDTAGILLVAESDYPGWGATIDGQPVEKYRAFTTIRAICVPAGEHQIEWTYRPQSFIYGGIFSVFTIILMAVGVYKLGFRSKSAEL